MPADPRHIAGRAAEDAALAHLVDAGLEVVARNHRCRFGEIDLVMLDGATLVFVEVRLRRHAGYGSGADSITAAKRRRLVLAARHYLGGLRRSVLPPCRFDVVSVSRRNYPMNLEWIRNAFTEDG